MTAPLNEHEWEQKLAEARRLTDAAIADGKRIWQQHYDRAVAAGLLTPELNIDPETILQAFDKDTTQ